MEQKKRQLEESVDSLNEELVQLRAQGMDFPLNITITRKHGAIGIGENMVLVFFLSG